MLELWSSIETIMMQIERGQVSITLPVIQLGNGAAIAMVEDLDGNIIEFVQEAIIRESIDP